MTGAYSWIKAVLDINLPNTDWSKGVDLDENGTVEETECIQDYNKDGYIGDTGDWENFLTLNSVGLQNKITFFKDASQFRVDNPIHEIASIEADVVEPEKIEHVYAFTAKVLKIVDLRLMDGVERTPKDKLKLVYRAMEELGMKYKEGALLSDNLAEGELDCDASSFIVLAVAHEMDWPVYAVKLPKHVFVRWDDGKGIRFNADLGKFFDDDHYRKEWKLSETTLKRGSYLVSMTREELLGDFFGLRASVRPKHWIKEAYDDYNIAMLYNPNDPRNYFSRAIANEEVGRDEEALRDYDQGLSLYPEHPRAHYYRGLQKIKLKLYEEGISDLEKAVQLGYKSAELFFELGKANVELGHYKYDGAFYCFDEALRLDPSMLELYRYRSDLRTRFGYSGREPEQFYSKYDEDARTKYFEEAIQDYTAILRLDPNDRKSRYMRGQLREQLGLLKEALQDYTAIVALDPKNASANKDRQRVLTKINS